MAAAILTHRATAAGLDVDVSSAGVDAVPDEPATRDAVATMAARGLDISGHQSRLLGYDDIDRAQLILTMERRHLRAISVMAPGAFTRTFTLPEIVRRSGPLSGRLLPSLDAWLDYINVGRTPTDLLGRSRDDDVADPVGRGLATYEKTADRLQELVQNMVEILATFSAKRSA
jgi:protein-tyrosine phosphatase